MGDSRAGCQVWWAATADVRRWHESLLDDVERARRARYLRGQDRDRFTVGVALTRLVMARRSGVAPERIPIDRSCDQCGEPHGRPRIGEGIEPRPHLSISHSGDSVVLALSDEGPVGVDVEADTGRIGADIAGHLLSAAERAERAERAGSPGDDGAGPDATWLLAYWTRKEAVVKATGEGLRVPLPHLTVSAPDAPPRLLAWEGRPGFEERVRLCTLHPGIGYAACLALLDHSRTAAGSAATGAPHIAEFSAAELLSEPGRWARETPLRSVEP